MNYALVKELKEAGFPQGGDGAWDGGSGIIATQESMVYVPTIEELIEACGEGFYELHKNHYTGVKHTATLYEFKEPFYCTGGKDGERYSEGSTPTEAVARLWLSLQKSKVGR